MALYRILLISSSISSSLCCASLRISFFILNPSTSKNMANTLMVLTIIVFMVLVRFQGDIRWLMVLVGIFRQKNLAIESPFSLEKANNFFISAEVVMQKLVSARKAIPSSRMDLSPPIILNHSSTTFLSTLKCTYPAVFVSTEFIPAFWGFIISYLVSPLCSRLWFLGRECVHVVVLLAWFQQDPPYLLPYELPSPPQLLPQPLRPPQPPSPPQLLPQLPMPPQPPYIRQQYT